jgi:hypothetical protein
MPCMRYELYSNFWNKRLANICALNLELHIMLIPCRGHGACTSQGMSKDGLDQKNIL